MGIEYVDKDMIGHFCGGVLSSVLLQYSHVPVAYNFILANGIHYIMEKIEKYVAPNGRVLEVKGNQILDIIAFFVGWVVAYVLRLHQYLNRKISGFLWIILLFGTALEILREIYPYEPLVEGAYTTDI